MNLRFEKHKHKPWEELREDYQSNPQELGSVGVADGGKIKERDDISSYESLGAQQDIYDSREFRDALDDLFASQDAEVKVKTDIEALKMAQNPNVYEKNLRDEIEEQSPVRGIWYVDAETQRFLKLQSDMDELYNRLLEQRLEYRDTDDMEIDDTIKDRMEARLAFVQKNQKNIADIIELLETKRGECLVKSLREGTIQEEGEID